MPRSFRLHRRHGFRQPSRCAKNGHHAGGRLRRCKRFRKSSYRSRGPMKEADECSANDEQKTAAVNIAGPYRTIELRDLFRVEEWQDEIPWQPFVNGAEIHRL